MEKLNMEHRTPTRNEQRQKDLNKNALFTCHTISFWTWRHKDEQERKEKVNKVHNTNKQLPSVPKDTENVDSHTENE